MLTIRVIYEDGREELREVESVYKLYGNTPNTSYVQCVTPNTSFDYTSGNLYVMNNNGKTIASYTLG